jgi:hypothetical protein
MLKLYPDRTADAIGRMVADAVAVLWIVAWTIAGYLAFKTVLALEVIADGISSTGRTFNSWIDAFRSVTPRGIPGLSGFLLAQADALQKFSGDPIVAAGAHVHDDIYHLAVALALMIALPPILIVGVGYGLWRLRDAREMGAAMAFVRASQLSGRVEQARAVLAYRAVATLSFRQLMRASKDPVGDLAEHRYEALAAAMLERAGLDAYRLPGRDRPLLRPAPADVGREREEQYPEGYQPDG